MAKWNAKEKCSCQPNLGEVCSICHPPANIRIVKNNTETILNKILQEIKSLEQAEPSSYFTDAHIDGYNHALSDIKAIVKFEISTLGLDLECYCNDDRASGRFINGHFESCPQRK